MRNAGSEDAPTGWESTEWRSRLKVASTGATILAVVFVTTVRGLARGQITGEEALSVQVFNYVHFSNELLRQAENDASGIFRAAGVEITWRNCNVAESSLASEPSCQPPSGSIGFRVRLLSYLPTAPGAEGEPMGSAVGLMASVSLRRIREEAGRKQVMPQVVLGPVLAHEIGHLLLPTEGHSEIGIMRARWEPDDYAFPHVRALRFTVEQAEAIRSVLRGRAQSKDGREKATSRFRD